MRKRRDARTIAVQSMYRFEISRAPLAELLDYSWIDAQRRRAMAPATFEFASLLIAGCIDNLAAIDREIDRHLEHWDIERVSRIDLSVLRVGTYCLLHQRDIPAEVTIDESVAAARQFGGEHSYRFVNGVLDGIYRRFDAARGTVATGC
ncbi:MAG: transcription antitermination factor NusB [Spirochaetaceae bacterium]|nr:transcription antitermination factor NusB [Spirochaetaceae bacterium]